MGEMDRDGLTVVPEANAPLVTALAGGPVGDPAAEPGAKPPRKQSAEPAAEQPGRQQRRGTLRALHSKPFRLYYIGQVASASGSGPVITPISPAGGVLSSAGSTARQAFIGTLVTSNDLSSAVSLNGIV